MWILLLTTQLHLLQVLLKHFSNPSLENPNNYWGNQLAIEALADRRTCFRSNHAVKQARSYLLRHPVHGRNNV